jgi:hypothetical protein
MKKIMLSLATVLALTFTACDPVEDFTKNTASNYSEEQIDATLVQNGGDNLVEVTVHSNATAQISNGKQTFKANYAKVVMRELGENFIYVKLFNANGSTVERQYPVEVTNMKYELPVLETIIWQGEQSCGGWDGTSLRFSDSEGTGLPTLSDDTYDWMVGKTLSLDISAVNGDGTTIRVTNGHWSKDYVSDTPVTAGMKFQFEFTQEMCDQCKKGGEGRDLLFVSNNGLTITKFYFEL